MMEALPGERPRVRPGMVLYECARCHALNELYVSPRPTPLRCVQCGYPVLLKPRTDRATLISTSALSEEVRLFREPED